MAINNCVDCRHKCFCTDKKEKKKRHHLYGRMSLYIVSITNYLEENLTADMYFIENKSRTMLGNKIPCYVFKCLVSIYPSLTLTLASSHFLTSESPKKKNALPWYVMGPHMALLCSYMSRYCKL